MAHLIWCVVNKLLPVRKGDVQHQLLAFEQELFASSAELLRILLHCLFLLYLCSSLLNFIRKSHLNAQT